MNQLFRLKPNSVSIAQDRLTVFEASVLLSNYDGYLDGDKHTLELKEVKKA